MVTVRTKAVGRFVLADRRGTLAPGPSTASGAPDDRPLRLKLVGGAASPPPSAEAILPLGGTTADEFMTRLAVWLAGVAMNEKVAA